jgi:hypothetical protein
MLPKGDTHRKSWLFDLLTSTKLALFLCMILAGESVVGSLLYRGNTSFDEPFGFSIFASPLFIVPAALLTINIFLCVLRRVAKGTVRRRIPLLFAHASLIAAIGGMMVDGGLGDVYTGYFPFEYPSRAVHDWKVGQDIELPFTMEVSSYSVTRYPFLMKVGVRKNPGGEKVGLYVVREGGTLDVQGTGLVLRNIAFDPEENKIHFKALFRGNDLGDFVAGKEGSSPLGDGYTVVPVAFRDFGVKNMVARLKITEEGESLEYDVSPNHPAVYRGLNITLVESKLDKYNNLLVGFQITRTPGETLFWAGAIGFFTFVLVHFVTISSTNN